MLWIYLLIIIVIGLLGGMLFHHFIKNKMLAYSLTIATVVVALALTFFASPYYFAWRFESTVRNQNPFTNLIATHSPDEFNAYVAKVKNNILTKGDPNNEVYYTAELINALLLKYGPRATNESLYNYLKADIDLDKKLLTVDPVLVLFHEFPAKFKDKIDLSKYNASELKNTMLGAVEDVIVSGINNPQPLPSKEDLDKVQTVFQDIVANLSKKYGAPQVMATFQRPDDPSVDKKTAAEIMISLSEDILAKGQDTVGLLLRATFLTNENQAK